MVNLLTVGLVLMVLSLYSVLLDLLSVPTLRSYDLIGVLGAGKPVVTANKELVASRGPELIAAAERSGVPFLFEAAVGGGIPIIRPLSETLAGEPVERVLGIVEDLDGVGAIGEPLPRVDQVQQGLGGLVAAIPKRPLQQPASLSRNLLFPSGPGLSCDNVRQ